MKVATLIEVQNELNRFQSRLSDCANDGFEAWNEKDENGNWVRCEDPTKIANGRTTAALKRAALDLKILLTKITQNK